MALSDVDCEQARAGLASSDKARQGSRTAIDEIRYHSTHLMMAERPFDPRQQNIYVGSALTCDMRHVPREPWIKQFVGTCRSDTTS